MATIYTKLKPNVTFDKINASYLKFYSQQPLIRVKKTLPTLHDVVGSNYCDIGFSYNKVTNVLTTIVTIDNLIKGAAGQAIQNFNNMFNYPETEGLLSKPFLI